MPVESKKKSERKKYSSKQMTVGKGRASKENFNRRRRTSVAIQRVTTYANTAVACSLKRELKTQYKHVTGRNCCYVYLASMVQHV